MGKESWSLCFMLGWEHTGNWRVVRQCICQTTAKNDEKTLERPDWRETLFDTDHTGKREREQTGIVSTEPWQQSSHSAKSNTAWVGICWALHHWYKTLAALKSCHQSPKPKRSTLVSRIPSIKAANLQKDQRAETKNRTVCKKNQNICLCLMIGNRWILVDKWLLLKKSTSLFDALNQMVVQWLTILLYFGPMSFWTVAKAEQDLEPLQLWSPPHIGLFLFFFFFSFLLDFGPRICNWHDNCEVLRTLAVNHPFEISTLISNCLIVCIVLLNKHEQGHAK